MKRTITTLVLLIASLAILAQDINWKKTAVENAISAEAGSGYMLMTNRKAATVLLPENPSVGDKIGFLDIAGTFPFNGLTIDPGSIPINGVPGVQTYSTPHLSLTLVYTSSPYGWKTLNTSDILVNGSTSGQLLYWENGAWASTDPQQFSWDANTNKLIIHNIESVPLRTLIGNYNTEPPSWGNQFVTLSAEYGDITALLFDGQQIILHGGNSEGETLLSSDGVSPAMFYEGNTIFGVSPSSSYADYTSVTIQTEEISPLNITGDLVVSGDISSRYSALSSDTIALGRKTGILQIDSNSIFIGSPSNSIGLTNTVFISSQSQPRSDTLSASYAVIIGQDAASGTGNLWQSVIIGNGTAASSQINQAILMGYNTGQMMYNYNNNGSSSHPLGLGYQALRFASCDYTTAIGYEAGSSSHTKYSIFLGQRAGQYEDSSNRLIIKQTYINPTPLLYGDFLNGRLSINNKDVSSYNLNVEGTGHFSSTLTIDSTLIVSAPIWQTNTGNSVFLGQEAGYADDLTDNNNVFIGCQSGKSNTSGTYNAALGYQSMLYNSTGGFNTAVGAQAMLENTTGISNTAIGESSLNANTTGQANTALGRNSLQASATGSYNTAIGKGASYSNSAGSNNTVMGYQAGFNNISGSGNVFIGYKTAYNETTSNKLYINNTTGTPLIYGEFDNSFLRILGTLEVAQQLQFTELQPAPDSATAPGIEGEIRFTTDYIFVCTAANTWKRVPISTW